MLDEIRDDAQGRWLHIHSSLGIDAHYLRNRHMPCPGCGGRDRFRYDDKGGKGTFYCGGGGDPVHGDGFELLNHVHGWDFKTAAQEVRKVLGIEFGGMRKLPPKVMPISLPRIVRGLMLTSSGGPPRKMIAMWLPISTVRENRSRRAMGQLGVELRVS